MHDIATRTPIDKTSAIVTAKGFDYKPDVVIDNEYWDAQPKTIKKEKKEIDLTGVTFGEFIVIGKYKSHKRGALWVVKCSCGSYETRRRKAMFNINNSVDRCVYCRHKMQLKRKEFWRRDGKTPTQESISESMC